MKLIAQILSFLFLISGCSSSNFTVRSPANSEMPQKKKRIFQNVTHELGLPSGFKHNQTLVADLNQDNYPDLILTNNHKAPIQTKVFINQAGKFFKEVKVSGFTAAPKAVLKAARGLFDKTKWGVIVRYPNEALQGYVLDVSDSEIKFRKVKPSTIPPVVWNWGDVQIYDFNQDGRLDFFATSFYKEEKKAAAGPVVLFVQSANGDFNNLPILTFDKVLNGASVKSRDANVPSYMANVCDINDDGHLDLLIAGYGRRWNKLFIYSEKGYEDQANKLHFAGDANGGHEYRGNGNSFVSQCGDVDRDGKLDVFQGEITHDWAGPTSDLSSLLYNRYPAPFKRFTDFPRPKKFGDQGDLGADLGDIDLDGNLDLVIANSDYPPETKLITYLVDGGEGFEDISGTFEAVTNPKGVVLFDYDRDGDLDMILGENAVRGHVPSSKIFKNLTQENKRRSYLNLVLEGDGRIIAKSPIGARVKILNSEKPMMRELVPGGGQDAVRPLEAFFGVDEVQDYFIEVEIRWNAFMVERIKVERNRTYKIIYNYAGSSVRAL